MAVIFGQLKMGCLSCFQLVYSVLYIYGGDISTPRSRTSSLHNHHHSTLRACLLHGTRIFRSYSVPRITNSLKTSLVLPFARPSRAHIDAGQWRSPCRRSGASSKRRRGSPCILITADRCWSPHGLKNNVCPRGFS